MNNPVLKFCQKYICNEVNKFSNEFRENQIEKKYIVCNEGVIR